MSSRALISVYDKSGLVEFGRALTDRGFELVASGGTAGILREHGLGVSGVPPVAGAPALTARPCRPSTVGSG